MPYSRRLIPSTSMLIAFDSAARNGSFTAAAHELNLSQGAISRQVSALEAQLGVLLFKRVKKKIILTDAGRAYAREIHASLQAIRNASLNVITNPRGGSLNLAILPTFGTRWLMPRFPSFLEKNPDIFVNFVTKLSPFDFQNENVHAAIHFGLPEWPDAVNSFLMSEESVPVCSPKFLEDNPIKTPSDLSQIPLLHLASRQDAWGKWLKLQNAPVSDRQSMLFEQISFVAQAAVAGLGAALLPKFLIQPELKRGELVVIYEKPLPSKSGYYLIIPTENVDYPPVVAFKNWFLEITGT